MEPIIEQSRLVASPWAVLPRDLLGEIAGHMSDAADYVRFHAVCRAWRKAAPSRLLPPALTCPRFLPWLTVLCNDLFLHVPINYGCVSSGMTSSDNDYCDGVVLPAASSSNPNKNFMVSADGTAAWLFTVHPERTMVDILTGASNPLPRLPMDDEMYQWMKRSGGIVYRDGTVFMYGFVSNKHGFGDRSIFTAAILHTGDGAWKPVKENLSWRESSRLSFACHDRKVLACDGLQFSFLKLDFEGDWINWRPEGDSRVDTKYNQYYYVFESGGELMRATVLVDKNYWWCRPSGDDPTCASSVMVYAMEGVDSDGMMRWVARDSQNLMDRVLFLGSPVSFTADAAHLGIRGGYVYFFFSSRVFKYSLIDREAQLMERLRPWWGSGMARMWLQPRPAIARVHKVQKS